MEEILKQCHLKNNYQPLSLLPLEKTTLSPFLPLLTTANVSLRASSQTWNNSAQFIFTFEYSWFYSRPEDFICSKLGRFSTSIKSEKLLSLLKIPTFLMPFENRSYDFRTNTTPATHCEVLQSLGKSSALR